MADGKKSFVLYADLIHTVEKMPDEIAGKLFKHILAYVNDQNPVSDDLLLNLVFEPIKQQMKRDLNKWEEIREKRIQAGLASAEARREQASKANTDQQASTHVESVEQTPANPTVNGTVTVNGNVNEKKKKEGVTAPPPPLESVITYFKQNGYTEEAARKAWNYYNASLSEGGRVWKDGKGQTVKNWKQKMQAVWFKDENRVNFVKQTATAPQKPIRPWDLPDWNPNPQQ